MTHTLVTMVKPVPRSLFVLRGVSAEMRWEGMAGQGYHTPTDRFFVRNHTRTPHIDAATWRLRVHGEGVRQAAGWSYEQLRAMPSRTVDAAIECAGNGRRFYGTQQGEPAPGTQWGLGAIGVARWRGVPLRDLLRASGIRREAVDVLARGLDAPFEDYGRVRRPLPAGKAMDDVLVAYEMNGEPLPPDHGFPVRLVVPGWAGIASIKWLGDIQVFTREIFTPWNTEFYRDVAEQPVKSAFELAWDATLPAGGPYVLRGRSWSGHGRIVRVEVSTDGGATWRKAGHHGQHLVRAWLPWHVEWAPSRPGQHVLMARATDETGATQPAATPWHPQGYGFDAVVRHPVRVPLG
ncbi:sulfite oxidase [Nonomuraea sp. SBT364]|uniref:sulfite oxidase n=1 Tax=Nonomuraea sp. SBT364 TaxID=1580530 RepID=UPI00069DA4F5|nr:sulfite oxidase [Nonomuraea sp. SBT364]